MKNIVSSKKKNYKFLLERKMKDCGVFMFSCDGTIWSHSNEGHGKETNKHVNDGDYI